MQRGTPLPVCVGVVGVRVGFRAGIRVCKRACVWVCRRACVMRACVCACVCVCARVPYQEGMLHQVHSHDANCLVKLRKKVLHILEIEVASVAAKGSMDILQLLLAPVAAPSSYRAHSPCEV